jgi:hypothetical protein
MRNKCEGLVRLFAALLITTVVAGCAQSPVRSPEQALESRAREYWEAHRLRDYHTVYRLEADAQPRGSLTPADMADFVRSKPDRVIQYTFKDVVVNGAAGEVKIALRLGLANYEGAGVTKQIKDTWVLIDGQWYHQPPRRERPLAETLHRGMGGGSETPTPP